MRTSVAFVKIDSVKIMAEINFFSQDQKSIHKYVYYILFASILHQFCIGKNHDRNSLSTHVNPVASVKICTQRIECEPTTNPTIRIVSIHTVDR